LNSIKVTVNRSIVIVCSPCISSIRLSDKVYSK